MSPIAHAPRDDNSCGIDRPVRVVAARRSFSPMSTPLTSPMRHRHLREGVPLSGPALDDIVARGTWADWGALRDLVVAHPSIREPLRGLCTARLRDPDAATARYRVWMAYLEQLAKG